MIVLILQRVSASLRGELTRWLLEPRTGVFVGRVSALVRDKLWELAIEKLKDGEALLLYQTDTEQGIAIKQIGQSDRAVIDYEGILLIQHLN